MSLVRVCKVEARVCPCITYERKGQLGDSYLPVFVRRQLSDTMRRFFDVLTKAEGLNAPKKKKESNVGN